jgi:hypothetical protein
MAWPTFFMSKSCFIKASRSQFFFVKNRFEGLNVLKINFSVAEDVNQSDMPDA